MTGEPSSKLNDTQNKCRNMSAKPPIIKSEAENSFIIGLMSAQKAWVWLGMKRKQDKMVWLDGTPAEPSHGALYSAWKKGEPSKNVNEDCAYLNFGDGGWNDFKCVHSPAAGPYVLCQKERKKDVSSKIDG